MSHDTGTVSGRFQAIASRFASNEALAFREADRWNRWSYAELASRADAIASGLSMLGVVSGDAVGIVASRTADTMASVIAILEVGAHYVPLDPSHPAARLRLLCASAGVRLVLDGATPRVGDGLPSGVMRHRVSEVAGSAPGISRPSAAITPETPAYVMFTSGSTGEPKGVVVPHRAIVRLVDEPDFMRLDATRVVLHLAPLSFDASTLELWAPLLNGGTCVLYPDDQPPTADGLRAVIAECGVTSAWLTASLFNGLVDQDASCLAGLEELLTGGEALSVPHVMRALRGMPKTQLVNGYGPTENTTFTTCYRIPASFPGTRPAVPIGYPISGTTVAVVDDALNPVPDGMEGELVAFGRGVALGYVGKPALTAERFVELEVGGVRGVGYRTGDRVVRHGDGLIDFLGRFDDQVKIEGRRIEPGEIERVITGMPGIATSRVVVLESPTGQKRLAAYVVATDPARRESLRADVAALLPAFMIPHFLVFLDALPTNANGKLDRAKLPSPFAEPHAATPALASRSPESASVLELWRSILGHAAFGDDTNFFDAGGTSLDAVHLQEQLARRLGRSLDPMFVFEHPTTRRQAEALRAAQGGQAAAAGGVQRGQQRRAALSRHARGG